MQLWQACAPGLSYLLQPNSLVQTLLYMPLATHPWNSQCRRRCRKNRHLCRFRPSLSCSQNGADTSLSNHDCIDHTPKSTRTYNYGFLCTRCASTGKYATRLKIVRLLELAGENVTGHIDHLEPPHAEIGSLLLKCCDLAPMMAPTCDMHILCEMLQFLFDCQNFLPSALEICCCYHTYSETQKAQRCKLPCSMLSLLVSPQLCCWSCS